MFFNKFIFFMDLHYARSSEAWSLRQRSALPKSKGNAGLVIWIFLRILEFRTQACWELSPVNDGGMELCFPEEVPGYSRWLRLMSSLYFMRYINILLLNDLWCRLACLGSVTHNLRNLYYTNLLWSGKRWSWSLGWTQMVKWLQHLPTKGKETAHEHMLSL